MLTVLLGLAGAVTYGFADFLGGLAAKRIPAVLVTAVTAAVGLVPILVGLLVVESAFSRDAVLFGVLGGLSGTLGVVLLYGALAVGPMSVLSPITAVVSAILPVVVGVFRGIALSPVGVGAVVLAIVAVVLVAAVDDHSGARISVRGLLTALCSGAAFGGLVLAFAATPADSGAAPLLVARTVQVVVMGAIVLVGATLTRRVPSRAGGRGPARWWTRGLVWTLVACGCCDAAANVFIQAGLHSSSDPSVLPVMSVLNALYPIGTIVLATFVLRERLGAVQVLGMALALIASVGLALS